MKNAIMYTKIADCRSSHRYSDICLVILITSLAILCAYSKYSTALALSIAFFEIAVLLYCLVKRDIVKYYALFVVFTGTALSHSVFIYNDATAVLYTFTQLPVVEGFHIPILLLAPILFGFNFSRFKNRLLENHQIKVMILFLFAMYVSGTLFGLITLLFNDNGLRDHFDLWFFLFRRNLLLYTNLTLFLVGISYCFLISKKLRDGFYRYLLVFLLGISLAAIISVLVGWSADYGSNTTLLLSQAAIFGVFLMVYPLYVKTKFIKGLVCFSIGASSSYLMLYRTSELAGKWWIYTAVVLVALIIKLAISKNLFLKGLSIFVIILFVSVLIYLLHNDVGFGLSETKLHQFIETINVFDRNWYNNLPASPKARIDELVNALFEYFEKPFYFFFGKGFSSSFIQRWGTSDWSVNSVNVFTTLELQYGVYGNMHETVNKIILSFGLLGIVLLIREIWFFAKTFRHSFASLVGFMWFIFFFNSGYSALYIGACCFVFAKLSSQKVLCAKP